MKYAVVRIKGNQYKVSEGEELLVDKLETKKPEAEVLLVVDREKVKIGNPKVKGAKVTLKVLEEKVKGEKLQVRKYKAKSRYRRKIGFRPQYARLQIGKIAA